MLDILRKQKRSWIILIPLGVIIVTFVLFYGGQGGGDPSNENVAEINGEAITQAEFALHHQRLLERYQEMFKGSLTPELVRTLNLRSGLLAELIDQRLLLQEARRLGLTATDEELMNAIAQVPEFQLNGRFNKDRYVQLLRANRLTPGQFETEQREALTIQKLRGVILDAVRITEAEVRERYHVEQEKINLAYVRIPIGDILSRTEVTEEEIKKFFDANKESLREPLRVQVEYLSYPFEQFSSKVEVSDKEIEDYYQANREAKFHKLKEARMRHILTRVPPGADAGQRDAARARAQRILASARAGKDFAQLAKENSDDPSAAQGGEVGWLSQGQLLPALEKAVFSLGKGEISDVIESPSGYHIVKVEDVRAERTQSLKEATAEIIRTLKSEKAKREAVRAADRDREKLLSGAEFAQIARDSQIPLKTTPWITSGETLPEIGPAQDFYKTAFSLAPKELGPVVEGTNAYHLLRIKDKKEPTIPPLESVRPVVEKSLKESKAFAALTRKAGELLAQLKKLKDIKALAKEHDLIVEETGWFVRSAAQFPKIGALQETAPREIALSSHKPFADQVFTQKNAAYLLAFKESRPADLASFDQEKERMMREALNESQQRAMQKFIESLKAKAEIQIQAQALEVS